MRLFWRYGIRDTGYGLRDELDAVVGVLVLVDAGVFLVAVVGPVFGPVTVAVRGSSFDDGFGAAQSPAGPGEVRSVLDEVAAGAFDDAGGDRPARVCGRSGSPGRSVRVAGPGEFPRVYGEFAVGGSTAADCLASWRSPLKRRRCGGLRC